MNKNIGGSIVEMVTLETNTLGDVGYNEEKQELVAEFRRGGAYVYSAVPKSVYDGLLAAASPDEYFSVNIKNGYSYNRVG